MSDKPIYKVNSKTGWITKVYMNHAQIRYIISQIEQLANEYDIEPTTLARMIMQELELINKKG